MLGSAKNGAAGGRHGGVADSHGQTQRPLSGCCRRGSSQLIFMYTQVTRLFATAVADVRMRSSCVCLQLWLTTVLGTST